MKKGSLAICRYCGKEFFIKPSTKGFFCSKICANLQRKKDGCLTGICLCCGKSFVYYRSCGKGKYCSNKCRIKHRKVFIEKTCRGCGKIFIVQKYEIKRKYCSHKCFLSVFRGAEDKSCYKTKEFRENRSKAQKEVWRKIKCGVYHKPDFSYMKTSEWKDKHKNSIRRAFNEHRHPAGEKTTTKNQDMEIIHLYKDCLMTAKQIKNILGFSQTLIFSRLKEYGVKIRKNSGCNNHFWKHGNSQKSYGSNWQAKRKEALKRDNYTCQECLSTDRVHVHHKKEIGFFKTEEDKCCFGNDIDNLITLCKKCHSKKHGRNIF